MSETSGRHRLVPFFLPKSSRQIFCLYLAPAERLERTSAVLFFPPFAEELNKSRRMMSIMARKAAAIGQGCLIIDLYGTGDSAGHLHDASLEVWREDMLGAAQWLREQGYSHLSLIGVRFGALLALDVAAELSHVSDTIALWQPISAGRQVVRDFNRLRMAEELFERTLHDVVSSSNEGIVEEIGGYQVNRSLLEEISNYDMRKMGIPTQRVAWLNVAISVAQDRDPAKRVLDAWQRAGVDLRFKSVSGERFWSSAEITTAPELIQETVAWLATSQNGRIPRNPRCL